MTELWADSVACDHPSLACDEFAMDMQLKGENAWKFARPQHLRGNEQKVVVMCGGLALGVCLASLHWSSNFTCAESYISILSGGL